jgi:hypothetical protein
LSDPFELVAGSVGVGCRAGGVGHRGTVAHRIECERVANAVAELLALISFTRS